MNILRILEKYRISLKFINTAFKKYLTLSEIYAIVFNNSNLKRDENKNKQDSLSSINDSDNDLGSSSDEELKKNLVINEDKKNNAKVEKVFLMISNKLFCHKFNIPINDKEIVDNLLSELISLKK